VDLVLLIDKPAGMTSHDVVAVIRRTLGGPKTGHAGTLDPFATGLLLVLVGKATRSQTTFMGLTKRYETVARFGATSTTQDPEGEITETGRMAPADLALPTGQLRQRPPKYSAVKVGGERAYKRARRGESFQMPERIVDVHRFTQRWREDDRACFEIECSSGTYVRSLIADLGDAYCESLRRTAIGPFEVGDAVAPPPRAARTQPGAAAAATAGAQASQPPAASALDGAHGSQQTPQPAWLPTAPAALALERALELAHGG
jgi:tRNA pseudouridine55 synthase